MIAKGWLVCALLGVLVAVVAVPVSAGQDNVKFEDGKLYVDGKPFFFWGFIWRSGCNSFEEMRKFGFNACLAGAKTPAEFDEALDNSVRLMVYHGSDSQPPAEWIAKHPATVAWFVGDDMSWHGGARICQERVEQIRKIDQVLPALADLNARQVGSDILFNDILEIYAPYAYPLPTRGYRWYFHDFLDKLREGTGNKYLWTACQSASIYSIHGRMGFTWGDMYRFPTPGQFRLLCWGGIAHGIRGFMFWKDSGLLPADMDNGDRTAEAVIIAHELEMIGDEIVAGDDVRHTVHCANVDVDVGRIDLADHTILIASLVRENYHFAMDDALAEIELTLPRPPQLGGELRAYSFGFPELGPVALREEGGWLIVGPHRIEITDVIVIEELGAIQDEHAAQVKERLPGVASTVQALVNYQHEKMDWVNSSLIALDVDVPWARDAFNRAVELKDQSAREFGDDRFGQSFRTARAAQRHYRRMLWAYREHAVRFKDRVPEHLHIYLMMPYGLPKYFASFGDTLVGP